MPKKVKENVGPALVGAGLLALMFIGGREDYEFYNGVTSPLLVLAIKTTIALALMATGVALSGGERDE